MVLQLHHRLITYKMTMKIFLWFDSPLEGYSLLIIQASLWSDQPVAETSSCQHKHSQETDIHAPGGIGTQNSTKRMAADPRLKPQGHWDGQVLCL